MKNEKNNGGKPPLGVHHQKAQHDRGFTGIRQPGHDPIQAIATFALSELTLHRIAIDLILSGLLPGGVELQGIGFGHFRWTP